MRALLCAAVLLFATPAWAATINAASASYADVNTAVSSAASGDTVVVPAGSATWSSQLNISKGLTLQGAGIGQTVITSNLKNVDTLYLINYVPADPTLNEPFSLTGFTLDGGIGINPPGSGQLFIRSTSSTVALTKIKVYNNKFQNGATRAISMPGLEFGVIYNNQFVDNNIAIYDGNSETNGVNYALTQGGANYPFVENNTFSDNANRGGFVVETGRGGRLVFRHNTISGYHGPADEIWDAHGAANPPTDNGTVSVEYYDNAIDVPATTRIFNQRGGKAIVFNNTLTGEAASVKPINLTEYQAWFFCTSAVYPKPQQVNNSFYWNNPANGVEIVPSLVCPSSTPSCTLCTPTQFDDTYIQQNRDYFLPAFGLDISKPGTCALNSYYGATDTEKLYLCSPVNTWALQYTPYTYPHPLVGAGEAPGGTGASPRGFLMRPGSL